MKKTYKAPESEFLVVEMLEAITVSGDVDLETSGGWEDMLPDFDL